MITLSILDEPDPDPDTSSEEEMSAEEGGEATESKWSLTELEDYFNEQGWDYSNTLSKIEALLVRTVIAVEPTITSTMHRSAALKKPPTGPSSALSGGASAVFGSAEKKGDDEDDLVGLDSLMLFGGQSQAAGSPLVGGQSLMFPSGANQVLGPGKQTSPCFEM